MICKDSRGHAKKIIYYEKKKIVPLTTKEEIRYNEQKICYICKKEFNLVIMIKNNKK